MVLRALREASVALREDDGQVCGVLEYPSMVYAQKVAVVGDRPPAPATSVAGLANGLALDLGTILPASPGGRRICT